MPVGVFAFHDGMTSVNEKPGCTQGDIHWPTSYDVPPTDVRPIGVPMVRLPPATETPSRLPAVQSASLENCRNRVLP